MRTFAFDAAVLISALAAMVLLVGCSEGSVEKVCGTNQYWPQTDETILAEQLSLFKEGQPIRNQAEDWERMRCENASCVKGYDVCANGKGPQQ